MRNEQQEEFRKMIPKVEYVMDEHADILTDQEERWLYEYLQFITNQSTSCPNTIIDKAKTMVFYLSRL